MDLEAAVLPVPALALVEMATGPSGAEVVSVPVGAKGSTSGPGLGYDADVHLVEVHMSSLRHKLETHGPRMVHTIRGAGYVLRP